MQLNHTFLCGQCPYKNGNICIKVGGPLESFGWCEDAFGYEKQLASKAGYRKTGPAYRRRMNKQKKARLVRIIRNTKIAFQAGPYLSTWEDGISPYIKYSGIQGTAYWKNLKRQTSHLVRHKKDVPNGNAYRKYVDSWWCW